MFSHPVYLFLRKFSLQDSRGGSIRRYDRQQNIICGECRKSEVMLRVLAFYQGNFQEAIL
ncbi:hypothetical protein C6543_27945 [Escherichia coli]|nr:hypothetical protein [Escherichia coli]